MENCLKDQTTSYLRLFWQTRGPWGLRRPLVLSWIVPKDGRRTGSGLWLASLPPNTFPETLPRAEPRTQVSNPQRQLSGSSSSPPAYIGASLSAVKFYVEMKPKIMSWDVDEECCNETLYQNEDCAVRAPQTTTLLQARIVTRGECGRSAVTVAEGEGERKRNLGNCPRSLFLLPGPEFKSLSRSRAVSGWEGPRSWLFRPDLCRSPTSTHLQLTRLLWEGIGEYRPLPDLRKFSPARCIRFFPSSERRTRSGAGPSAQGDGVLGPLPEGRGLQSPRSGTQALSRIWGAHWARAPAGARSSAGERAQPHAPPAMARTPLGSAAESARGGKPADLPGLADCQPRIPKELGPESLLVVFGGRRERAWRPPRQRGGRGGTGSRFTLHLLPVTSRGPAPCSHGGTEIALAQQMAPGSSWRERAQGEARRWGARLGAPSQRRLGAPARSTWRPRGRSAAAAGGQRRRSDGLWRHLPRRPSRKRGSAGGPRRAPSGWPECPSASDLPSQRPETPPEMPVAAITTPMVAVLPKWWKGGPSTPGRSCAPAWGRRKGCSGPGTRWPCVGYQGISDPPHVRENRSPRVQQGEVGGGDWRGEVFVAPKVGSRLQWSQAVGKGSSSAPQTRAEQPVCGHLHSLSEDAPGHSLHHRGR